MSARTRWLPHVHNFRGLAAIFIVVTHCLSVFDWKDSPALEDLLKRAVANGTIGFLFIGGYLFDHLSDGFRARDYWKSKVKNVVLPYVIVSVPALVAFTTVMRREDVRAGFYDQPIVLQVLEFLLTGAHLAPFWFIPTIVVFYVAAPVLLRVFRDARAYWCLPVLMLIPVFVPRGAHSPLQSFVHFLPVWVLGMACSRFAPASERIAGRAIPLLIVAAVGAFVAEVLLTKGTHSPYSTLGKLALSVLILELLRRAGNSANRWLALAGTLSFGIFFLHSYVITAAKLLIGRSLGVMPSGSVLGVALAAVAAVCLTMALVVCIRRILGPARSRMVIGT